MAISAGSIQSEFKLDISDFSTKMKIVESTIKQSEKNLSGYKDIGDRISGIGQSLTTHLSLPIAGVGVAAAKLWSDFKTGMAKVSTVSDETQVPIKELGDQIIKMSDKTGLATSDMESGLYDVLSAGVQTKDSMKYLDVAVKSAKGGFTDTATAVDGLTSTLNAYGLEASKANDIANQMMVAQNLGKTTFGELAGVVGNVAPIFSAAGASTKELFSSFAVLTSNGIKTSEAATGLKAAMTNIINPTKEAKDAAQALGLDFNANTIKSKGWMGTLQGVRDALQKASPTYAKAVDDNNNLTIKMQELEKAGKKGSSQYKELSEQQKNSEATMKSLEQANQGTLSGFATMFGSIEGLNSVLSLTSTQGAKLYNDSMGQMGDGIDRVDQAYKKMDATPGSQMQKSFTQLKNAGITMGDALAPIMTNISKAISNFSMSIQNLSPGQKKMITDVLMAAAVLGPLLLVIGKTVVAVGRIKTAIDVTKDAIGGLKTAAAGAGGIGKLFMSGMGPWILGAMAIAAVVFLIIKNWSSLKTFFTKLWADITKEINKVWTDITTFFTKTWNDLVKSANTIWNKLGSFFTGLWNGIKATTQNIWNGIKSIFTTIWNGIVNAVMAIVKPFEVGIENIFNSLSAGITTIFNGIKTFFTGIWDAIKLIFMGPILLICDLVTGNWTKLNEDTQKIFTGLQKAFTEIWDGIKGIFTGVIQAIVGFCEMEWNGIVATAESIWNGLVSFFSGLWEGIKSTAISAWEGLKTAVSTTITNTVSAIKSIWNGIIDFFGTFPSVLYNKGVSIFDGLKNGIWSILSTLGSWIKTNMDSALDFFKNLPSEALQWGKDFIQGFINGIKNMGNGVKDAATGIADKIRKVLHFSVPDEGPLKDADTYGSDFVQVLIDGMNRKMSALKTTATSLAQLVKSSFNKSDENPDFTEDISKLIPNDIDSKVKSLRDAVLNNKDTNLGLYGKYEDNVNLAYKSALDNIDIAMGKLSISTGNLTTDLKNQQEQVAIQTEKTKLLTDVWNEMGYMYGYSSKQCLDAKKNAEESSAEIEKLGQTVIDTKQKVEDTTVSDINDLFSKVKDALKQSYDDEEKASEDYWQGQIDKNTKWKEDTLKNLETVYNSKKSELDKEKTLLSRSNANQDDNDKEAEYRKILSMNYSASAKAEAQKNLDDLLKEENRRHQSELLDDQENALDAQYNNDKQKTEDTAQAIETNYNLQISTIKTFYENKQKEANLDAEAEQLIISNNQDKIVGLLKSYGSDYEVAGASLGERLVSGFKDKLSSVQQIMAGVTNQLNSIIEKVSTTTIMANSKLSYANDGSSNPSDITNNQYGNLLHADTVNINNGMSIEALAEELAFYFNKKKK